METIVDNGLNSISKPSSHGKISLEDVESKKSLHL
jgi:hypothetical protein